MIRPFLPFAPMRRRDYALHIPLRLRVTLPWVTSLAWCIGWAVIGQAVGGGTGAVVALAPRAWQAPRSSEEVWGLLIGLPDAGRQAGSPKMADIAPHKDACLVDFSNLENDDLKRAAISVLLAGGASQLQVKTLLRGDTTRTSTLISEVTGGN